MTASKSNQSTQGNGLAFLSSSFIVFCLVAAICCIVGGHPLNPFKNTAFASSDSINMALWGVCGRGSTLFTTYDEGWMKIQNSCITIFSGPSFDASTAANQYINFGRRVSVTSLHALAFIFTVVALLLSFSKKFSTATGLMLTAFIFQAVGFSLAVYEFDGIIKTMKTDKSVATNNPDFAPGMYISGALCVAYVMAANLCFITGKAFSRRSATTTPIPDFQI